MRTLTYSLHFVYMISFITKIKYPFILVENVDYFKLTENFKCYHML